MKVLLIAPYVYLSLWGGVNRKGREANREDFYPSAALLHLAAVLRANNYEPVIIDLNNTLVHNQKDNYLSYCKKIIIEALNEHKPDLVGLNCLFSGVFPDVLQFAETIKSHSPNIKIATGGIHPTSFYKEILTNCKDIDYIAIGEGENAIVSLARAVETKNYDLLSDIKSFAFRDLKGDIKINTEKNYIDDLNKLPTPAWDLINLNEFEMKLDSYYNPKKLPLKFNAAIFASRACPLACNFCDMFIVMGKKHRKRNVDTIVNEMEILHKDYNVNYFSFMDDQLTLNRGHTMDLCNEIIKRGLNIHFDTPNGVWINSLREDVIAKMVEAGLVKTSLAIEHGDDYMRNTIIGKKLDRKKIFEVAGLLKKYKVLIGGFFIMGFPEETNETLEKTYDMINELQLDTSGVATCIPYPGTALFKQVIKDKDNLLIGEWKLNELWKTPMSLAQNDFIVKPYKMSLDDLYRWREKFNKIKRKYWKKSINSKAKHIFNQHNIFTSNPNL